MKAETAPERTQSDDSFVVTESVIEQAPEKKRSLYDISSDFGEFDALVDSIDGEVTPEQQEQLDAYYEKLSEERDAKLDAYGGLLKDIEARGKARKEEAERILALANADLNKVKMLKGRLLGFFQVNNITDAIQTLRFKFRRQNNGGKTPVVLAPEYQDDPNLIPEQFVKYVPQIDLDLIRATLEGEDAEQKALLDGIATLGERGEHLRIA